MYRNFFKRLIDCVLSLAGLVVCGIPMLFIAVMIKTTKGPVIFRQDRLGKGEKHFTVYKFRTMVDKAYENGGLATKSNDPRITKIGRFLRRTSLDEIPQMFNILKGDMSFVGPRPPLPREVENYDEEAMCRLAVVGGLTCYWQISGRSTIDFNGMVKLDKQYIEERGIWTDIKILFKTIPAVFRAEGAY